MNLKKLIGSMAPTVGALVGGPIGAKVATGLAEILGCESDEGSLEEALVTATPEQIKQIKAMENDYKVRMEELGVDVLRLDKEDRDSARDMAKNTNLKPQFVLGGVAVVGYFGILYTVFTTGVPENVPEMIVGVLIGALTARFEQVFNFFFGSSAGSKSKTKGLLKDKGA